jgi:hypothetical protein
MATQQGDRQASFRTIGSGTSDYNGDALAAFAAEATIPAGATFNGALIAWLQERLGSSDDNLPNLMAAFAAEQGAGSWGSVGSFYAATPVAFDGVNDYLTRGTGLTGAVDSKFYTGSLWFRRSDGIGVDQRIFADNAGRIQLQVTTGNALLLLAVDSGLTTILQATMATISDTEWHHLAWSVNMADTGERWVLLDTAVVAATWTTYTDAEIDFTGGNLAIGARTNGTLPFIGDLADLRLWDGVLLDLSVAGNQALLVTPGGHPVRPDLGNATIGSPIVQFSGSLATWHENKGSGGGFTENGELTDGTGPVQV